MSDAARSIDHAEMLKLKRWNTPTIYNGWEQVSSHPIAEDILNAINEAAVQFGRNVAEKFQGNQGEW